MYVHHSLGFFKNVDRFIVVSHFYRNKLIANGFSEQQICYLPNFIEPDDYPLSFENDGSIIYLGRLSKEKGVSTLLKAAEYCPDSKFIIIGTGPEEAQLKQESQLLKNVEFVGFQSGQALLDLIKNALCTVLPSVCYENCPMSILESQAMGKPVIGSHIGGIPELIDEGKDGFTFEMGNAKDLANKILTLRSYSNQQLKEMAQYARNKIEQRFSSEQHYENLMQIYSEVIKK
jgi:glycosyltransferase involved in cell wall biosynthesis